MAVFGLGNYLYELNVDNGSANFHFYDPEDAENTADVSVPQSDFNGAKATDRTIADLAFAQCQKVMNDKRDARQAREQIDALKAKQTEDRRQRDAETDFINNSRELADTTPTGSQREAQEDKKAPAHSPQSQDSVPDDSRKKK
jgi:hypothetical protein